MQEVIREVNGCHLTLWLNRPDKRNALSPEIIAGLTSAIREVSSDPGIRTITLAAKGPVFCAGADLEKLQQISGQTDEENYTDSHAIADLFLTILDSPKPFFARIQGDALAGGCGLVSVCDFSVADEAASFGYPEVRIGFVPAIVAVLLVRKIGEGKSRPLLLSGKKISATAARDIGLIQEVVRQNELDPWLELARKPFEEAVSPDSVRLTRRLLMQTPGTGIDSAIDAACQINVASRRTDDCREGIRAFLEKRPPRFGSPEK